MTDQSDAPPPGGGAVRPSPRWRAIFLAGLAETSNVSQSAKAAGIAVSRVYHTKRSDRAFARAWQMALCEGYDQLEVELLGRVRSGEGQAPGVKYDNGTALRLLLAHRDSRARFQAEQDNVSADAVRASLNAKLAALRERVLARGLPESALPGSGLPGEAAPDA